MEFYFLQKVQKRRECLLQRINYILFYTGRKDLFCCDLKSMLTTPLQHFFTPFCINDITETPPGIETAISHARETTY